MYSHGVYSFILIGCWLGWLGYWFVTWRSTKETEQAEPPKQGVLYLALLVVAFVLLIADTGSLPFLGHHLRNPSTALLLIGAILAVIGVITTIWARRTLADNWSASTELKKQHSLIQDGPYALVRHPIYAGLFAMFVGTAIVSGSVAAWLSVLCALISFLIRINLEEKLLSTHFPEAYAKYMTHTKALIPLIY